MRRSAAAVGLTAIGLWLVLTFKSSPLSPASSRVATLPTLPTSPADAGTSASGAAPPDPVTSGPASPATTPTTGGSRTVTGATFTNRYGPVQVAVVLNGTRIVDVRAIQMPHDRARSADISSQAAPLLHDEVLQAQSAQIDTIGGATYTSGSYAQSLQSALDQAHG